MDITKAEVERRMKFFRESCRRAGLKATQQRLVIFGELTKSADHPSAESVFESVRKQLPTISLDTVYRTLWMLKDLGLISTLGNPRERVRFDANTQPHHHYICRNCGLTADFYSAAFDELPVPDDLTEIGTVESAQVELRGLCRRCFKHK